MNDDDFPSKSVDGQRRTLSDGGSSGQGINAWGVVDTAGTVDNNPDVEIDALETSLELELFEDGREEQSEDNSYDQGAYPDEPEDFETEPQAEARSRSVALFIVGLVALVLLAVGGYGVMQQRAAARDEIRSLQAALASAASPAEVAAIREALQEMEQQSAKYLATIEVQKLYNKRLADRVAELEQQLGVQQGEAPRKSEPGQAVATETSGMPAAEYAAAEMAPSQDSAVVVEGGDWFVNFGSYSRRSAAENWVTKLSTAAGKAVVAPAQKDGMTFYRVRIVGLADRAQAEKVAGELQTAHSMPPLWVGKD